MYVPRSYYHAYQIGVGLVTPALGAITNLAGTDDMTKVRGKAPTGGPGSDRAERAGEKAGLETNLNLDEAV